MQYHVLWVYLGMTTALTLSPIICPSANRNGLIPACTALHSLHGGSKTNPNIPAGDLNAALVPAISSDCGFHYQPAPVTCPTLPHSLQDAQDAHDALITGYQGTGYRR